MNQKSIDIQGRTIGAEQPPFIIAELSGNHDGSIDKAHQIIDAIADAGADAVKLQTYTADTLTIDCDEPDFVIKGSNSPWEGRNLYSLYEEAHTPWEWHEALFRHARERNLICFSSPFDASAVEFLGQLDCPAYKIASFENNYPDLIRTAAQTGKPVIISTGLADAAEIQDAVTAAREAGCEDLILLKCTSSYPAEPINSNLLTIPHMRELFQCPVGLSDHTLGIGVPIAAAALGAVAIEKHVTLSRAEGGVDSEFSLEPDELAALVSETRRAWQAMGTVTYGPTEGEAGSVAFRRSLYVVRDMAAGETISDDNVRVIRPGYGLSPKYFETVRGMRVNQAIERGTPLSWKHLG